MVQTVVYLPVGTASWAVPLDCNLIDSVDCYASGGSGAVTAYNTSNGPTGGGGGAFSRKNNIPVTPGSAIGCSIGVGGAGVSTSTGGAANGNPGGDTNFGGLCYAQGGRGGNVSTAGGAGGDASAGIGDVRYSGGRGGNCAGPQQPTGGGGCAGPSGNGINGSDVSSAVASAGGYGDNYAGGAGSAGSKPGFNTNANSDQGGTGTEAGGGYGSGGGSGSAQTAGSPGYNAVSGTGGQFGGGTGGAQGTSSGHAAYSGQAHHGFIVVRYTPIKRLPPQNLPMMGL